MKYQFLSHTQKLLADTYTPVQLFLNIREYYPEAILFETDSRVRETATSYICFQPVASINLRHTTLTEIYPDGIEDNHTVDPTTDLAALIDSFINRFDVDDKDHFMKNGVHGYLSYDALQYLDGPALSATAATNKEIPLLHFSFYRFVLVYDHHKQQLSITERYLQNEEPSGLGKIHDIIRERVMAYPFSISGEEVTGQTDEAFLGNVEEGKKHCMKGDVFQVVLSRGFSVPYKGDDFNVYRRLRSINPSPYMFYCDFGGYRLLGSSPEAQIVIKDNTAVIHPIAGTFRKTGDEVADKLLAEQLLNDPKENAEHVMLVDLARNDLSKNFDKVQVSSYKKIHHFSHVLHIVSAVTGSQPIGTTSSFRILADSFPAGTLSGAPKHRAIQLIDKYEQTSRGFYGGCIGYVGFNGDVNTAIMIRSMLSKNNLLHYQAGAGIVAASVPQSELEEVNNKLGAVRTAIHQAKTPIYEEHAAY